MSPSEYYFHDRASVHGGLDPWSDDQTTALYESRHLYSMQPARPVTRTFAVGSAEPSILEDYVLPDILEAYDLEPEYPARASVRAAQPVRRVSPARVGSRNATPPRPIASSHGARLTVVPQANSGAPTASRQSSPRPQLRPVPAAVDYDETEEDNPFARSHMSASIWLRTTAAVAGLFAAVLFGRVLLEPGQLPSAQGAMPLTAAGPDLTPEPAAPSSAGAAAPGLVAAAGAIASPQPSAAGSERPDERLAGRPRRQRTTLEAAADQSERRAAASERRAEASARRAEARARRLEARAQRAEAKAARQPTLRSVAPEPAIAEQRPSNKASGASGLLRINSRPWSQVFIDGKLIGNTPQLGIQLPAGKHNVRLVNPEFGMSKTIALKLAAGESVSRIEMLNE